MTGHRDRDAAGAAGADRLDLGDDELLALAARLLDPLLGRPVPPPALDREHFLALARGVRRRRARSRRRLRWAAGVAAFVAVLATLGLAGLTGHMGRHGSDGAPVAAVPAPAPLTLAAPQPAAERLLALAERARRADPVPGSGRVTYVRTRTWTAPAGGGAAPVTEEQTWWEPDLSGQQRLCAVAGFTAPRAAADCGVQDAVDPASAPIALTDPADSPAVLAAQLAHAGPLPDPERPAPVFLDRVVALMRTAALSPAQRAAALQVLADTPGIVQRGDVTDPLGRPGLAVTVEPVGGPAPVTVAVFDVDSGQLLAVERLAQPSRAADGTAGAETPRAVEVVMLLDIRHTREPS